MSKKFPKSKDRKWESSTHKYRMLENPGKIQTVKKNCVTGMYFLDLLYNPNRIKKVQREMTDEGISYILKNCDVQQDQFLFEKYWWP